jgi:DnaA N-terminal domain
MPASTTSVTARTSPLFHTMPTLPSAYVAIPQRLITDLHDSPLALGLYALVSRLFLIHQSPIALSVPDVLRFDPSLSRGAVLRARARLITGGWLVEQAQIGHKSRYLPTWGRVNGQPLPWQLRQPCLGRPRHIARLCLDRQLLDTCMGKLTPHPTRATAITRYLSAPVLALVDIGSYALTLAGLPHETPILRWLGLVRDGLALPLPDESRLLALISQRTLRLDDTGDDPTHTIELTPSGARKLGLAPLIPPTPASESAPLFFVPKHLIGMLIGPMIGSMIGAGPADDTAPAASAGAETAPTAHPDRITWDSSDQPENMIPPPTPPSVAGGGASHQAESYRAAPRRAQTQPAREPQALPDTDSARALHALHVRPAQIRELADLPIAIVEAAITHGQARDDVRDLAGWVVSLLRAYRDHGWRIPTPTTRPDSPEALRAAFQRYAAEQAELQQPEPVEEPDAVTPPVAPAERDLPGLWREVLDRLQLRTHRQEFDRWLRGTELHAIASGVAAISVPNVQVKEAIERRYLGVLREVLSLLISEPLTVRVVLHGARRADMLPARTNGEANGSAPVAWDTRGPDAQVEDARPEWIAPATWASLPVLLRAVLLGSHREGDEICAASPQLDRLLRTRYALPIADLIAASGV